LAPVAYLALRIARRVLPPSAVQWMLRLRLGIEPGIETRQPERAADRYATALKNIDQDFVGKRILVLGYGGYFGLAVTLLTRGASHVVLLDPYARLKHSDNRKLAAPASPYLRVEVEKVVPDPHLITLVHERVSSYIKRDPRKMDLVLSSSVYEHISDPLSETRDLTQVTTDEGHHVHVIDLRDHFFRYPFEMLSYSKVIWDRWLNPPSNLNRFRAWQYEDVFQQCFYDVHLQVMEKDLEAFRKAKRRIRPEFLSGNEELDSASKIVVIAKNPRRENLE
jgi:hypothetical protein